MPTGNKASTYGSTMYYFCCCCIPYPFFIFKAIDVLPHGHSFAVNEAKYFGGKYNRKIMDRDSIYPFQIASNKQLFSTKMFTGVLLHTCLQSADAITNKGPPLDSQLEFLILKLKLKLNSNKCLKNYRSEGF